jgi:TonB family protein
MLQPVLGALAYLHGEGFVHSHLQPTNIMAVADQLKISSDGLRRAGESGGDLGRSRVYEPPEAATGAMSPAGDVWSLGITLVEALTQQAPVWKEKEQAGPALPGDLPSPFLEIARDCLHRDPRRRSTLADIAAQLQRPSPVAEKQAVPQKQTPSGQEKTVAKKRYLFPVVVAVLALLVILAIPRILNHPEAPPTQFPQEARDKDPQQTSAVPAPAPKPEAAATPPTGLPLQRGVVHQVVPDVPQSARDTIQGRVRVGVRVAVDSSGSVVDATLDSPGPSRYFARLALQAARGWRFTPAQGNGQGAASEWILRFEFGPTDTRVIPVPVSP